METPQWMLFLQNHKKDYIHNITKPQFHIGRDNNLDIVCPSIKVSRNHALLIVLQDGTLHVKDNGSANGTYVNRELITRNVLYELHVNDELGLGVHSLLHIPHLEPAERYVFTVKKSEPVIVVDDDDDEPPTAAAEEVPQNAECASTDQELLIIIDSRTLGKDQSVMQDHSKDGFLQQAARPSTSRENHNLLVENMNNAFSNHGFLQPANRPSTSRENLNLTVEDNNLPVHVNLAFPQLTGGPSTSHDNHNLTVENMNNAFSNHGFQQPAGKPSTSRKNVNLTVEDNNLPVHVSPRLTAGPSTSHDNHNLKVENMNNAFSNHGFQQPAGKPSTSRKNLNLTVEDNNLPVHVSPRLTAGPSTSHDNHNLKVENMNNAFSNHGFQHPAARPSTSRENLNLDLESNVLPHRKHVFLQSAVLPSKSRKSNIIKVENEKVLSLMKQKDLVDMENNSNTVAVKQEPLNTEDVREHKYTVEEGCIVIDDDDDDFDFPCSQLLQNDVDNTNIDEQQHLNDSIFCAIKLEVEELDKMADGVLLNPVLIDSDTEESQDLINDLQSNFGDIEENVEDVEEDKNKLNNEPDLQGEEVAESNISNKDTFLPTTRGSVNGQRKYVTPPVVEPHFEVKHKNSRKNDNLTGKRKSIEKEEEEEEANKKIKTRHFYNQKHDKRRTSGRQSAKSISKEKKELIHEIRKKQLKEIEEKRKKSNKTDKITKSPKGKSAAAAKVKISESRGNFLIDNAIPSTSAAAPKVKISESRGNSLIDNAIPSTSKGATSRPSASAKFNIKSSSNIVKNGFTSKSVSFAPVHHAKVKQGISVNNNNRIRDSGSAASVHHVKANQGTVVNNNKRIQDSVSAGSVHHVKTNHRTVVNNNNKIQDSTSLVPSDPRNGIQHNSIAPVHASAKIHSSPIDYQVEDVLVKMLYWNATWFEERKKNEKLGIPPILSAPLSRVTKNYASYKEYSEIMLPLLMVELWYFILKEIENSTGDPRRKCFRAMVESESRKQNKYTVLDCFTYISKEQSDRYQYVKEEDILVLQYRFEDQDRTYTSTSLGYVIKVNRKILQGTDIIDREFAGTLGIPPRAQIYFKVMIKPSRGAREIYKHIRVRVITSSISTMRIFKSIKHLEHSDLCPFVLKPSFDLYKLPRVPRKELFSQDKLNPVQHQAVMQASFMCMGQEPGIFLIQGPPGTGKTTVIINIIQQILFHESSKEPRILVVAPSNAAVDELVLRLVNLKPKLNRESRKEVKLVRIGPKNIVSPNVQDYLLCETAKRNIYQDLLKTVSPENKKNMEALQHQMTILKTQNTAQAQTELAHVARELDRLAKRLMGRSYHGKCREMEETLLSGARIICTTLSSCVGIRMSEVFGGASKKFNCCIVDEATQCNEQESLIPLKLGINRMVLVGDPKQLPAVTLGKEAKDYGYGQSLFSRIVSNFPERLTDNPIRMLTTQYRMHPEICRYPNQEFYGKLLINASSVTGRKSPLNVLKPYRVFNCDLEFSNSQEYRNRSEIECVLMLLDAIILKIEESCSYTVGIVTPYNDQKSAISDKLKEQTFRPNVSITVNTVDSFQGQERDIIIMSCVRINSNNFLRDEHRLNVAITRAKHALYIIGTANLFKTCEVLGKIRDNAVMRHLLVNVKANMSMERLLSYITSRKEKL